jgi:hypothetical protein
MSNEGPAFFQHPARRLLGPAERENLVDVISEQIHGPSFDHWPSGRDGPNYRKALLNSFDQACIEHKIARVEYSLVERLKKELFDHTKQPEIYEAFEAIMELCKAQPADLSKKPIKPLR